MKSYEHFLVAELIFQRDHLQFHTLPQTAHQYYKIFGKLENQTNQLNLNIQILRRKIELLKKNISEKDMEAMIQREFHPQWEALQEIEYEKFLYSNLSALSQEEKQTQDNIYRQILLLSAPQLYDLNEREQNEFHSACLAYSRYELKCPSSYSCFKGERKDLSALQWEKLKEDLQMEIFQIYDAFPMNRQEMLEKEQVKTFHYERLQQLLQDYSLLYRQLEEEFHLQRAQQIMK